MTFPEYGNTETVSLGEMDWPDGREADRERDGRRGNDYREGSRDRRGGGGGGSRGYYDDRGRDYDRRGRRGGRDDYRDRSHDRSRSRERYHRSSGNNDDTDGDLLAEVLRRERDQTTARGKAYAAPVATTKDCLAVKAPKGRAERDENRHSYNRHYNNDNRSGRHQENRHGRKDDRSGGGRADRGGGTSSPPAVGHREKTPEELAAIADKKRRLAARYG